MKLHPIVQEYVNTDTLLLSILEKNYCKDQFLEVAFFNMVKAAENKKFDQKIILELDQAIISGHPDPNVYLMFIAKSISYFFSFNQNEKAVSLYSIISSALNENVHPVVQAMCMQANVQIKIIEGKVNERNLLMANSMLLVDKKCPRYKSFFYNYSKMLAANGRLNELNKNEQKTFSSLANINVIYYLETILMNSIMVGDLNEGFAILKNNKNIIQENESVILDCAKDLLNIVSGDFNENNYQKEGFKIFSRTLNCLVTANFDEATKHFKTLFTITNKITTGHLEKYLPLHIELCKRNKIAARILMKEIERNYGTHYLDDLFYGRLQLLENDFNGADQFFARLIENVNKYGAMNRLSFELQFAKEMKLSDILLLMQGWKKNKNLGIPEKTPVVEKASIRIDTGIDLLIGNSNAITQVKELVKKYASLKPPVLVTGETGTGKELVSRAIHDEGLYPQEPFLAINCGALTESLLQSEFYGYVAGAFTGAQKERLGIFEAAGKGTVFLDEFGDISPQLQVSLLRVLESNEIRMIGGTVNRKIACRIIIATNVELQNAVREKKFREDLYYRLAKFEIRIPALRERLEDLPLLVDYLLNAEKGILEKSKMVSKDLLNALSTYKWPGNIRELKNELDRLKILNADKDILTMEDFDFTHLQVGLESTNQKTINFQSSTNSITFDNTILMKSSNEAIDKIIQRGSKAEQRQAFIKELFLKYKKLTRCQVMEITKTGQSTATNDLAVLIEIGFIVRRSPTKSPRTDYFEINSSV